MIRKSLTAAAAVACALLAVPSATAASDQAEFELTVTTSDGDTRSGTLRCGPVGGEHQRPVSACRELAKVDGDFERLNVRPDRACTLHLDPVEVTARGHWAGEPVTFQTAYGNPCVFAVTTGPVFAV